MTHWDLIEKLGTAEETVDTFDDDEYTTLKEAVFKEVCIHPVHHQRCENYA